MLRISQVIGTSPSLVLLLIFCRLPVPGFSQLQSSTTKQSISGSSDLLCAADSATTLSQARSLVDCQRICYTQKNKCYSSNFYSDTMRCETFNFKPTTFTSSRPTCKFFKNADTWSTTPGGELQTQSRGCLIEAFSYGYLDTAAPNGYIAVNGSRVLDSTFPAPNVISRGIDFVELNVTTCKAIKTSYYVTSDTYTESNNMATYINGLPTYTVLIAVCADDCFLCLNNNGLSALLSVGVNVTGLGLQRWGKLAFVAQTGQPAATVSQVAPPGGNGTKLTVTATGSLSNSYVTFTKQ